MSAHRCRSALAAMGALAALGLWLGACATRIPERARGPAIDGQGDSSQLVFHAPAIAANLADGHGWERSRRNAMLAGRRPMSLASRALPTALDQWPTRSIPSLDRARRLLLSTSARSVIYFDHGARRDDHDHDVYDYDAPWLPW